MSGLSRTPGKRVQGDTLTRVRIPPSPPVCQGTLRSPFIFKDFRLHGGSRVMGSCHHGAKSGAKDGALHDVDDISDEAMKSLGMERHGSNWRVTKHIPADLISHYGKTRLRENTKTPDRREAKRHALNWLAELEEEFARVRETGTQYRTVITDDEITRICTGWFASSLRTDKRLRMEGFYLDDPELVESGCIEEGTATTDRLRARVKRGAIAHDALTRGVFADELRLTALSLLKQHGYQLDQSQLNRFMYALAERVREAVEAANKLEKEGIVTPPPEIPPPASTPVQVPTKKPVIRLSAVIERFMDVQKAVDKLPMYRKYAQVLPMFLGIIGDKPIGDLRQTDIEDFCMLVCELPPRWADELRRQKLEPTRKAVEKIAKGNRGTTISPKTYEDSYIAAIRPFLGYATRVYGDQGFPRHLTVEGIAYRGNMKAGQHKQRPFTADELTHLFTCEYMNSARRSLSREHEFWFPLIGLYTGARINEVCQLNPQSDIRQEQGIWVFDFTDEGEAVEGVRRSIKNEVSKRAVPIHSKLIELGFLKYFERIKAAGKKMLFPMWPPTRGKASGKAEKEFRKLLEGLGLRDDTPGKRLVGYHAFRFTVRNRAVTLGLPKEFRVIEGHAGEATVTATERGYEGSLPVTKLHELMEQLQYDLDLKPLHKEPL